MLLLHINFDSSFQTKRTIRFCRYARMVERRSSTRAALEPVSKDYPTVDYLSLSTSFI